MMRLNLRGVALALLTLGTGCRGEASAQVEPSADPVDVETARAEEALVPETVLLTASLRGAEESKLSPNASGRVVETRVDAGSKVKKGDVLMRLDTRAAALSASEATSQVDLARARRDSAARECERSKVLFEAGAMSKADYERASDACKTSSIDVRVAEVRATQAAQTLGDGTVRAPFDGVVTERLVERGEYVRADTAIVRVATLDALRLSIEVPETYVAAATVGKEVTFGVSAYPERRWRARISRGGVLVRPASRDVVVEALVDNRDEALLSGMFATVDLPVREVSAVIVPRRAVFDADGKTHVFVKVDGRAEERAVQLGPPMPEEKVAVRRGLTKGDAVITARPAELTNGAAVK